MLEQTERCNTYEQAVDLSKCVDGQVTEESDVFAPDIHTCRQQTNQPTVSTANVASNPNIIFVIGAPGVGKGTLCSRLANSGIIHHLSTGDYLRELKNSEPPLAALDGLTTEELKVKMVRQSLIPAEAIVQILKYKLEVDAKHVDRPLLIDGFPRLEESAKIFDQTIGAPSAVLFFDCPKETAQARFLRRGRGTDDEPVFARRYKEFEESNDPIVERYKDIVHQIDTEVGFEEAYEGLLAFFAAHKKD